MYPRPPPIPPLLFCSHCGRPADSRNPPPPSQSHPGAVEGAGGDVRGAAPCRTTPCWDGFGGGPPHPQGLKDHPPSEPWAPRIRPSCEAKAFCAHKPKKRSFTLKRYGAEQHPSPPPLCMGTEPSLLASLGLGGAVEHSTPPPNVSVSDTSLLINPRGKAMGVSSALLCSPQHWLWGVGGSPTSPPP